VRSRYAPRSIVRMLSLCSVAMILATASQSFAAGQQSDIPTWLTAHVGQGDGQIARPILQRARSLYMRKVSEGKVRNSCYFAMDATRPNDPSDGGRFYIVCEATQTFRVVSSGHGSGRDLKGVVDFGNGRMCARNFGNAMDSNLTTGGSYMTEETKTTFKGYYPSSQAKDVAYLRTFLQFDGEGETANARQRAIGGHAAAKVAGVCMKKDPQSPYANRDGYVPLGWLSMPVAAATAARAGRLRMPTRSSRWSRTIRRRSISTLSQATSMRSPRLSRLAGRRHRRDCIGTIPA